MKSPVLMAAFLRTLPFAAALAITGCATNPPTPAHNPSKPDLEFIGQTTLGPGIGIEGLMAAMNADGDLYGKIWDAAYASGHRGFPEAVENLHRAFLAGRFHHSNGIVKYKEYRVAIGRGQQIPDWVALVKD